jgi:hypothetical protein
MRRSDGRGFESHATAEQYNGHLISARTPSTATTGEIPVNQAGDLGMLLQTEDRGDGTLFVSQCPLPLSPFSSLSLSLSLSRTLTTLYPYNISFLPPELPKPLHLPPLRYDLSPYLTPNTLHLYLSLCKLKIPIQTRTRTSLRYNTLTFTATIALPGRL